MDGKQVHMVVHFVCGHVEEVLFLLTSPTCYVGRRAFQHTCMLNATAAAIIPVVTKLFNFSISTGSFPQAAKSSVLVHVSLPESEPVSKARINTKSSVMLCTDAESNASAVQSMKVL